MNVAIVGATGYGGIQAVNLLKKNKKYKISFLGGNKTSGSKWNDNFPFIYLDNDPYIEEISVDNISKNADYYFDHSYECIPLKTNVILSETNYGINNKFVSIVSDRNIYGIQFHPEKSPPNGLFLLKNFINIK